MTKGELLDKFDELNKSNIFEYKLVSYNFKDETVEFYVYNKGFTDYFKMSTSDIENIPNLDNFLIYTIKKRNKKNYIRKWTRRNQFNPNTIYNY